VIAALSGIRFPKYGAKLRKVFLITKYFEKKVVKMVFKLNLIFVRGQKPAQFVLQNILLRRISPVWRGAQRF
jgi:hypothetical protein